VHSRETVFVIQREDGTIVARGTVPTTPDGLARVCHDHYLPPGTGVALETGTSTFYVARTTLMRSGARRIAFAEERPAGRARVAQRRTPGTLSLHGPHSELGHQNAADNAVPASSLRPDPDRRGERHQAAPLRGPMTRRNAEQFAERYECSAPIITLDDPHIRSTRTSSRCVPVAATRPQSSRWPIGSLACCMPCCVTGRSSSPRGCGSRKALRADDHATPSPHAEIGGAACHRLMRARSPARQ
jgi:hypothetical protein